MSSPPPPLRVAVVGGHRGGSFRRALAAMPGKAQLSAVCDRNPEVLAGWRQEAPELKSFQRLEDLLSADACDAVLLATPIQVHAPQAIAALSADKHVLCEVVAGATLDELWALVEAAEQARERSGVQYMMAENYCYTRPNMMVRHLVDQGLFGDLTYAEGAYIHDTRMLLFDKDGELTWRGQIARDLTGNTYPTHSLGPVAQWLRTTSGGGRAPSDHFTELVCYSTPDTARWRYAAERFGPRHPAAQPGFWNMGDTASVLLHTERGALVHLRRDAASPRPHNMTHYVLQGTQASYLSPRFGGEDPLVWIKGRSPGGQPGEPIGREQWQSLWDFADEYEHPRWKERGAVAQQSGHGGGDYLVFEDFVDSIRTGAPPAVDVYDAATWSSVFALSMESVQAGGKTVAIPNFRQRATRASAGR